MNHDHHLYVRIQDIHFRWWNKSHTVSKGSRRGCHFLYFYTKYLDRRNIFTSILSYTRAYRYSPRKPTEIRIPYLQYLSKVTIIRGMFSFNLLLVHPSLLITSIDHYIALWFISYDSTFFFTTLSGLICSNTLVAWQNNDFIIDCQMFILQESSMSWSFLISSMSLSFLIATETAWLLLRFISKDHLL